ERVDAGRRALVATVRGHDEELADTTAIRDEGELRRGDAAGAGQGLDDLVRDQAAELREIVAIPDDEARLLLATARDVPHAQIRAQPRLVALDLALHDRV